MSFRSVASSRASSSLLRHRAISRPTVCVYCRHHSHGAPPTFQPGSQTSAHTEIPYGDPSQASAAYLPIKSTSNRTATNGPSPTSSSSFGSNEASTSKISDLAEEAIKSSPRQLTAKQRDLLEKIIRVDQAGEVGANYIYQGQHAVLKRGRDQNVADLIQEMWDGEKKHIAVFDKLITQHSIRPTALYPLCKAAGWGLGAMTALMGNRAAMACTEAVETVIGEHYDAQLIALEEANFPADHASIPLLKELLAEFRDDELGHLETAVANESQQAPAYALLSAVIAGGCRAAIKATGKI